MPQLTLEYTGNIDRIDFTALFGALHDVLATLGGVRIQNCKSRAIRLAEFHIAEGAPEEAFVHLRASVLDGRTVEWRQHLGERLLEVLKTHYAPAAAHFRLQITVHMAEIERRSYFKWPEGTFTPLEQTA